MKSFNKILPLQIYLTAVLYVGEMGFAQDTWVAQTSGTSADLHSVYFVDSITGWVAGKGGTLLGTHDGGTMWQPLNSGVSDDLISVFFANADTDWVSGRGGTILKTRDGGETWQIFLKLLP